MEFKYGDVIEITNVPERLVGNVLLETPGIRFKILEVEEINNLSSLLVIDAGALIWINSYCVKKGQCCDLVG